MRPTTARVVQRAYKFALNPSPAQKAVFTQHAGGVRFAYNWALDLMLPGLDEIRRALIAGEKPNVKVPDHFELCKLWTAHKNRFRDEAPPGRDRPLSWVADIDSGTIQAALRDADRARKNYADSRTGRRKGRKMGPPKFKSRHGSTPSFQMHGGTLDIVDKSQIKPKTGWKWSTPVPGARRRSKKARPPHHLNARGGARTPDRVQQRVELDRIDFGLKLPKVGPVAIPLQVRLPGFVDRNRRVARSLHRALLKPPVQCPTCKTTGEITVPAHVLKSGVARPEKTSPCGVCKGTGVAPAARMIRATVSRGASGTWWASVTADVVMDLPAIDCSGCNSSGKVIVEEKRLVKCEACGGAPEGCSDCESTGKVTVKEPHLVVCKTCEGRTYLPAPSRRQATNGTLGLDLGTMYLAVDSDGTLYENPGHLGKSLAELKTAQRTLARCQPDSKRHEKAKRRVGTIHERVGLQRRDSVNRLATNLVHRFATVATEGWDAQRLAAVGSADVPAHIRRKRNRQLADAAPGIFRGRLSLKAPWVGSTHVVTPKLQETGRTCPRCATVRAKPIPPSTDEFACAVCGYVADRRVASARVVRAVAMGAIASRVSEPPTPDKPRGEGVRPEAVRRRGQPSVKRASRTRKRGKTGTPDP